MIWKSATKLSAAKTTLMAIPRNLFMPLPRKKTIRETTYGAMQKRSQRD
jgi:hypothetical protein